MTFQLPRPSRRRLLGLAALGLSGLGASAVVAAFPDPKVIRRSAVAFGTVVSITLVDDGQGEIEPAFSDAFSAIRGIERAASLFDPGSEISRLNRDGRVDRPSADLVALVEFALKLAGASGGAFDPTVQPVWLAWKAARDRGEFPSVADLARAVALVDYSSLHLDTGSIRLARPGMAVTLNALAQGLATDRVVATVAGRGIRHAFIDTGEIGARGHRPGGAPWRVGIADPRDPHRTVADVALASPRFIATSGDNACTWTDDFSEHHIVEPWSGRSPRELAEVSVLASSGLVADGLSTTAMVLGREKGIALLALDPGASALFIDKAGHLTTSGSGAGIG